MKKNLPFLLFFACITINYTGTAEGRPSGLINNTYIDITVGSKTSDSTGEVSISNTEIQQFIMSTIPSSVSSETYYLIPAIKWCFYVNQLVIAVHVLSPKINIKILLAAINKNSNDC